MKTIEMAEATAPLHEYARRVRREVLIVTLRGKPVAALTAIGANTDLENLTVSSDPGFRTLIAASRRRQAPGTGLTTAEVRRKLMVRRPARKSGR
jgi:antitoxin (DNA-binding transcriptional repressor) of toxin-antitoxin stability system